MSEYSWSYTDGVQTVEFIPLGRQAIWKGDSRTSERQLIGTKTSEINVFGALAPRLALTVLLEEYADVLLMIALDATSGTLTMDGPTVKTVTLMVSEVGAGELDGTCLAKVTFVET